MRILAIVITVVASACSQRNPKTISRIDLPLDQRMEVPQQVTSASLSLAEFAQFIATSFKVPLLVETPAPVPNLKIAEGTYSARALLKIAINQLRGFKWEDESGVAHIYEQHLARSSGNLLNVRVQQFAFPATVGQFMYLFRPCVYSIIQGYNCAGGAYSGFQLPQLDHGALPLGQTFKDRSARDILLTALKTNGRFYVLIAFDGTEPKLNDEYAFKNWFAESLEVSEPAHLWIQRPKAQGSVTDSQGNR